MRSIALWWASVCRRTVTLYPGERLTNPDKQKIRKAVDKVIARDREAGGMSYVDARRRYVEHCAFTLVNRIAALRAMEVRGFLPKSVIAQDAQYGGLSAWGRDILEAGSVGDSR